PARLRPRGKWLLLRGGENRLSVHSPVKLSAQPPILWRRMPLFWQAQLVAWGVFGLVDLVSQRLIFHDFAIAVPRTALIVACLVVISTGLRSVYASPRLANRLS